MKTCATISPADPGRPPPRPEEASAAVWGGPGQTPEVAFACPACASPLRVPRSMETVVGACPVCRSRVVAPQPEFGGHALPYREWLRLQEIDWPESPAAPGASVPAPARAPADPRPTAPATRPPRFPRLPKAARLTLAGAVLVGAWVWTQRAKAPPASTPSPVATSARREAIVPAEAPDPPTPEHGPEPTSARSPAAAAMAAAAPAPLPPLATVLDRQAAEGTVVVVRATRVHTFSRSAPAGDSFVCLKLTDEVDASVSTRAYLPLRSLAASTTPAALPWGRDQRVAVSLRWQEGDPATGVAGHWQVVTFDDATPSLSSAH